MFYIPYVSKILWFLSFSVRVFPLSIKNKQQNKLVDTENGMVVTREGKGVEGQSVMEVKYMAMEKNQISDGEYSTEYKDTEL